MKKLLLLLLLTVSSITGFSQDKMLDYFGQSEAFCNRYFQNPEIVRSNGFVFYTISFKGTPVTYIVDTKINKVVLVMLEYKTKDDRKFIIDYFNNLSKKQGKYWYLSTESTNIELKVSEDKKTKMFVFQAR